MTITDHATLLQSMKAKQEKNKRLRFSIFAGEEKDLSRVHLYGDIAKRSFHRPRSGNGGVFSIPSHLH